MGTHQHSSKQYRYRPSTNGRWLVVILILSLLNIPDQVMRLER